MKAVVELPDTSGTAQEPLVLSNRSIQLSVLLSPETMHTHATAPLQKLLWLAGYLRMRNDTHDLLLSDDMNRVVTTSVHALTELGGNMVDVLLSSMSEPAVDTEPSLVVDRSPSARIEAIHTTFAPQAVSIDVECTDTCIVSGARPEVDRTLHTLLRRLPDLCSFGSRTAFTIRDNRDAALLLITHPATDVPVELFSFLFDGTASTQKNSTRLVLSVRKCGITFNVGTGSNGTQRTELHFDIAMSVENATISDYSLSPLTMGLDNTFAMGRNMQKDSGIRSRPYTVPAYTH